MSPATRLLPLLLLPAAAACARPAVSVTASPASPSATAFVREELYFGGGRPGGDTVADSAWARFLRQEVTQRFPEGLTVLTGYGQYRGENGGIVSEPTRVLIVLYPNDRALSRRMDETVRRLVLLYKREFDQESVLRVTSVVRAAF